MGVILQKDLTKQTKQGMLHGGYLLYGEEEYLKRRALEGIRKALFPDGADDFCRVRLSGEDAGVLDALEGEVYALPMFSERKLVEVHSVNYTKLPPSDIERLCSILEVANEGEECVVVLYAGIGEFDEGRLPKAPSALYKKLSGVCSVVSFPYETPMGLNSWVCRHFAASGIACSPADASAIVDYCSRDMFTLAGEIEKLICHTLGKGQTAVSRADIEKVLCGRNINGAFDFTDALLKGRSEDACRLLSGMKTRRERPEIILGGVVDTLSGMYTVKTLSADGMSIDEISKKTGLHEYRVKNFLSAVSGKGKERLQKALSLCMEADREIKFSGIDSYTVLDRLVMRLCRV